jgi:GDP-L-fucose synthase
LEPRSYAGYRREVNLTRQEAVERWMTEPRPHAMFLAAAKVGGIHANDTSPAEFLYENLMTEANIIRAAWKTGVEKLLVVHLHLPQARPSLFARTPC